MLLSNNVRFVVLGPAVEASPWPFDREFGESDTLDGELTKIASGRASSRSESQIGYDMEMMRGTHTIYMREDEDGNSPIARDDLLMVVEEKIGGVWREYREEMRPRYEVRAIIHAAATGFVRADLIQVAGE